MEEIKRCQECGEQLPENANYCPRCGSTVQDEMVDFFEETEDLETQILEDESPEEESFLRKPSIWLVVIFLFVVSTLMNSYLNKNPIELANANNVNNKGYQDSPLSIKGKTSKYADATNTNMLGISYVNDDKVYITMNKELLAFNQDLTNPEVIINNYLTSFREDEKYYYYLNENNEYFRVDKESKNEDLLLTDVYYVHNLGEKVYYQKDTDNESIYCLDLTKNEDTKINDEVSYSLIIDEEKGRIFYVNKSAELISIALDGSDRKALASNTNIYTYDGEYLYYINNKGLVKCDLNGEHSNVYENANLKLVNIVNNRLVVHDNNIIYTMSFDGKDIKKLYTIEATGKLTFEVLGDKLLVLTSLYQEGNVGYEVVALDGKRHLLENNIAPQIIGEEI